MSYPPPGAKAPAELGAPPVADVVFIDRTVPNEPGASVRNHCAYYSRISSTAELWRALASAATAASDATARLEARELEARRALPLAVQETLNRRTRVLDEHDRAHVHLWEHLDPSLAAKSAAVKSVAQATSLDQLRTGSGGDKLGGIMRAWLGLADVVAHGMHWLFLAGVHEWDTGLDESQAVVKNPTEKQPVVERDAWMPFESYDRTNDPRYANCFGENDAQRYRSRVSVDQSRLSPEEKAATRTAWREAFVAHRRMLELEAEHALFAPGDPACSLTAPEVGGLFLLTNLPDNWAKRQDLFDASFWRLRAIHFGVERNCGIRMNRFSLQPLRAQGDNRVGCASLRRSAPDPMRSYCWLDNALHTMVALKVLIFWRLRAHAYDRAEGLPLKTEAELAALVRVDRHDIEQSKNHWLPATRDSNTKPPVLRLTDIDSNASNCAPKRPINKRAAVATPPSPPKPKAPCLAPAPPPEPKTTAAPRALDQVWSRTVERQRRAGLVTARVALASMAAERFKLRKRIGVLDRMVGLHLAHRRFCAAETQRLESEAEARIESLTERAEDEGRDEAERSAAKTEISDIAASFAMDRLRAVVTERVRRVAATEGLLWKFEDRLWRTGHASVRKLMEIELPVEDNDVHVRIPFDEWEEFFGDAGGVGVGVCGLAARCDPQNGWARREARSLADRLLALAHREAEYREVQSLEAMVPTPLECRVGVSLGLLDASATGVPEHVRTYAAALKDDEERKRAFGAFVQLCRRAMARAMQRCFYSCLADASGDRRCDDDASTDDDGDESPSNSTSKLRMPTRLLDAKHTIAVDVVHRFLNIAHAYGGLVVVDDATASLEEEEEKTTSILVYDRTTKRLLMPRPEDIVEQHWVATQHMLELATSVEPWVRDRRRHVDGALLLTRLQRWVTIDKDAGPHVHGHARERAVFHDLERSRDDRARFYWPSWPPRAHALCTPERLKTALLWGRHAACTALGESKRAKHEHVPNPPYHSCSETFGIDEHVWMHKAHTETMRVIAAEGDDEIDEVDLFGRDDDMDACESNIDMNDDEACRSPRL